MIIPENKLQSSSTEEGYESNSSSKDCKLESNFKLKKEFEENSSSNYFEETESLKYDSSYKVVLSDSKDNILRKSSTLSTNVSQSENCLDNLSPKKSCQNGSSSSLLNLNFSRERFSSTPISNYYDGTDNYFKGLYPEKNDYQKSNNYLEKRLFFREHFPSVDIDLMYKEKEKQQNFFSEENSEKNSTKTQLLNNSQPPTNLGKIEYPIYFLGYCGFDLTINGNIIPFTPKNYKKKESNQKNTQDKNDIKTEKEKEEEDKKKENKDNKDSKEKKQISIPMYMTPINTMPNAVFLGQAPMVKNYYNKFQGKKNKIFAERTGDWICNSCKNLNFAFRVVCNRCQLPKPKDSEKKETTEEKKIIFDPYYRHRFHYKNKYKYKKNYQYNNEQNSNINKNEEEK